MERYIPFFLPYFLAHVRSVNPCQHPIVILKDVPFEDLRAVVQFMYNGVVNVSAEKLTAVLKVRQAIKSLVLSIYLVMNAFVLHCIL